MTKQEAFNKAVRGLAKQGFRQSITPGGVCRFRMATKSGVRKCAIGHLVPDAKLFSKLRSSNSHIYEDNELICKAIGLRFNDFVWDLQIAHDCARSSGHMKDALRNLAADYGLKLPKVLRDE